MVQKYQNEIAPIFYYGISTKTNEKDLKIPYLQPPDWNHPYWMTLYKQVNYYLHYKHCQTSLTCLPEVDFKFPAYYQKTPLAAIKDTPPPPPPAARGGGESVTKTPFEIFLEDDGPYSRKLYGPVTPKSSLLDRSRERQSQKTFCHSKLVGGLNKLRREKLVYTPADNFREKVDGVFTN